MANLKDVIYLSNEDYETLVSTGTVTIDGTTLTYDENNVYITPDKLASTTEDGLMSSSDKSKLDSIASGAEVNVIESVKVNGTALTVSNKAVDITSVPSSIVTGLGTSAAKNYTTSVTSGSADLVTSGAVYNAIDNLPEPMIFKGTLGTSGTITTLPTASSDNEGYTYKVITAGTYSSIVCKVGDVVVSNGTEWVLIPAGDTDSDTWRNIKVNGTELLGSAISTDAVNFKNGSNVTITGSGNDITIAASQPTVNNATLTIQRNGTTVNTFTANSSTDVTANISVPTNMDGVSDNTYGMGYYQNAGAFEWTLYDEQDSQGDDIIVYFGAYENPLGVSLRQVYRNESDNKAYLTDIGYDGFNVDYIDATDDDETLADYFEGTPGTLTSATPLFSVSNEGSLLGIEGNSYINDIKGNVKLKRLQIPTTSGGSTYSNGSDGKIVKSNGSTVYWGTDNDTTYTFAEGSTNGAFSVTPSGGSAQSVSIHGLGSAAYRDISFTVAQSENKAISSGAVYSYMQDENLRWGGPSLAGNLSPLGTALMFPANRLAYINPNALDLEYSSDGGSTWTNYNLSDSNKTLLCLSGYDLAIGRPDKTTDCTLNSRTRVTFTCQDGTLDNPYLYCTPKKLLIENSLSGKAQVLIEYRTGADYLNDSAWTTFGTYNLLGWSGWNDIPLILANLGGYKTQTSSIWQLRLTFIVTEVNSSYPKEAELFGLRLYSDKIWIAPSDMAKTGHLYFYDANKGAKFPGYIKSADYYIKTGASTVEWSLRESDDILLIYRDNTAKMKFGDTYVAPGSDNSQDLGLSNNKWKDLYLSGSTNAQYYSNISTSRPTSADFSHYNSSESKGVPHIRYDVATNSMITNKPVTDGYITTYMWDNSGTFDAQLFIPNNNGASYHPQIRYATSSGWSSWENIMLEKDMPQITDLRGQ